MSSSATLSSTTLEQTIQQILMSHRMTRQDQRQIMSLLSKHVLSPQEENWISQLHTALRQGLLWVVD